MLEAGGGRVAGRTDPGPLSVDAAVERRTAGIPRWLVAAFVVSFVVRLILATQVPGPILTDDGLGYLGNARWLAGISTPDFTTSNFYGLGYSAVLAPLYLAGWGPDGVVLGARVINVLLATLIALPLGLIAQRVWPDLGARALWCGLAVSATPALLLQPAFIWPETLLPLLFSAWALCVLVAVRSAGWRPACLLSGIAVFAVLVHARATPLLAVTALVLMVLVARDGIRDRSTTARIVALVSLPIGFVGVRLAEAAARDAMWPLGRPRNADATDAILGKLSPDHWIELIQGFAGQFWYLSVATLGLVPVGLAWLAWRSWGGGIRTVVLDSRRLGVAGIGLGAAALMALSVLSISSGSRVDHAVYGRYNEMWAPVVAVVGLAWLLQVEARARRVLAVVGPIAAMGPVALVLVDGSRLTGNVMSLNVLGVVGVQSALEGRRWPFVPGLEPLQISLIVAGVALFVLLIAPQVRTGAALALCACALGVSAHVGQIVLFREFWFDSTQTLVEEIRARDPAGIATVEFERERGIGPSRNVLQFWLGDERVVAMSDEPASRFLIVLQGSVEPECYAPINTGRVAPVVLLERVESATC